MASNSSRALYIALETGGYGVSPDAQGANHVPVPAESVSELPTGKAHLDRSFADGSPGRSASIPGPDGGDGFSFSVPLTGLAPSAGDGDDPSALADDALDIILTHIFGSQVTRVGESAVSGSGSSLELSTDVVNPYDLVPVYEDGVPGSDPRTQWAYVTSGTGTYVVEPDFADTVSGDGIAYGTKLYKAPLHPQGGDTLSIVYVDGGGPVIGRYRLGGARVTSASVSADSNGRMLLNLTVAWDRREDVTSSHTMLPDALLAPTLSDIISVLSPVAIDIGSGAALIDASSWSLDFGIQRAAQNSTAGQNGRSGDLITAFMPQLTVTPLATAALQELSRNNGAIGRAIVQAGGGVLASTALNTMAFSIGSAQLTTLERQDDDNIARNSLTLMGNKTGTAEPVLQAARA